MDFDHGPFAHQSLGFDLYSGSREHPQHVEVQEEEAWVPMPSSAASAEQSGSLEHDSPARNGQREEQTEARRSGVHVKPFTISMSTDAVPGRGVIENMQSANDRCCVLTNRIRTSV